METRTDHSVLFIGEANTEGAISKLKVKRIWYLKKLLNSTPKNWERIASAIRQEGVKAVAMKIVPSDVIRFADPEYRQVGDAILDALATKPYVVFAYEGIIDGSSSRLASTFELRTRSVPTVRDCLDFFARMDGRNITVTPYKNLAELSIVVGAFIEDHDQDLLFRAYIPAERIYSSEIDQVMDMFRDWLSHAIGVAVRRDGYRTTSGSVYEFYGDGSVAKQDLPDLFAEFSSFLTLCADQPHVAATMLEAKGLDAASAFELAERYGRRGRRIAIDMKHDHERKMLQVRQSLESDVLELSELGTPDSETHAPGLIEPTFTPASVGSILNVNVNQQIVAGAGATVQSLVLGDAYLPDEARRLLALISRFASDLGEDETALSTAVHELEDEDAPHEARVDGKQRLKGFLYRVGSHGEKIAAALLQKYLESKIF